MHYNQRLIVAFVITIQWYRLVKSNQCNRAHTSYRFSSLINVPFAESMIQLRHSQHFHCPLFLLRRFHWIFMSIVLPAINHCKKRRVGKKLPILSVRDESTKFRCFEMGDGTGTTSLSGIVFCERANSFGYYLWHQRTDTNNGNERGWKRGWEANSQLWNSLLKWLGS